MASAETEFENEHGDNTSILIYDLQDSIMVIVTDINGEHNMMMTPMEFAKMRMVMLMHASCSDHDYLREINP